MLTTTPPIVSSKNPRQITIPLPDRDQLKKWVIQAIFWAIVLYLAYLVRQIWVPLGLAFIIATVLDPIVDKMEARGFSRTAGSVVIFGIFIIVVVGGIVLLVPQLTAQLEQIETYLTRYFPDSSTTGIRHSLTKMHLPAAVAGILTQAVQGIQGGYARSSSWLSEYGMSFLSNLVWVVIVPIVAFYALRDFHLILGKGLLLVPKTRRGIFQTYVGEVTSIFARYLRGLFLVSVMNGIATYILLLVLKVPSALVLGAIAGILYSVPYIGAILTIVLTGGLAFVAGGPKLAMLTVGSSMLLHQVIFDQIVTPRVIGGQVGLHPILSIVALLSGNLLLGIIGMILAVPLAACIQIGVLAIVPKLRQEIDLKSTSGDGTDLHEQTPRATPNAQSDETYDLHKTVQTAVDDVEERIDNARPEVS